jgi:3-oxoacyl-[acyl-carrier protein] reductase
MSRALAREIGSRNITVNCIAPGFIDTDMTKALSAEQHASLLTQIPLARLGAPEDIAHAVAFLAGPQAAYITGTTLHVNGHVYELMRKWHDGRPRQVPRGGPFRQNLII